MNEVQNKLELYNQTSIVQDSSKAEKDNIDLLDKAISVESEDIIDLGNEFDFDGFQVVRREFFAHLKEPSATFNNCKFSVNVACIKKFPKTDYVQVLVNQEKRILALRPCDENARDAYLWCITSRGKRKPRAITCKLFFAKIVSLMGWNPEYKYKLLGRIVHANGEYLLVFDLTATEIYQRTLTEGQKQRTSRIPVFPAEWQNQFGLPYKDHQQEMQINIFDGYAIFAIQEREKAAEELITPPQTDIKSVINAGDPRTDQGGASLV